MLLRRPERWSHQSRRKAERSGNLRSSANARGSRRPLSGGRCSGRQIALGRLFSAPLPYEPNQRWNARQRRGMLGLIDGIEIRLERVVTRNLDDRWTHANSGVRFMSKQAANLHRRTFLKTAVSTGAAIIAAPHIIPSSALGKDGAVAPSERIVLGGIGIGNRGTYDLGCFLEQGDVQFVAVCDVKEARRVAVKKIADRKYGNQDCRMYRDFRELLDRKDIDAVLIATGPNWHCTMASYAARAGKDMYCEKPCTKNISQSLALAETMRRTGVVFQAGTQRRNLPHFAFACVLARM